MLRQVTFTVAVRTESGAGAGPDGLLFLIQDPLTALTLIEALAAGLKRAVNEDNPITIGFTGEMEGDREDGPSEAGERF